MLYMLEGLLQKNKKREKKKERHQSASSEQVEKDSRSFREDLAGRGVLRPSLLRYLPHGPGTEPVTGFNLQGLMYLFLSLK